MNVWLFDGGEAGWSLDETGSQSGRSTLSPVRCDPIATISSIQAAPFKTSIMRAYVNYRAQATGII